MMKDFLSHGYRERVGPADKEHRGVEFLCGHYSGVAVGPFRNDLVVDALWKFESINGCEEEMFSELGLFVKRCKAVRLGRL